MLKLQEELKSGNISVGNSKRFGRFDGYFLLEGAISIGRELLFDAAP
jgi:hypothetical protein